MVQFKKEFDKEREREREIIMGRILSHVCSGSLLRRFLTSLLRNNNYKHHPSFCRPVASRQVVVKH